jgi:TnpA family transposase
MDDLDFQWCIFDKWRDRNQSNSLPSPGQAVDGCTLPKRLESRQFLRMELQHVVRGLVPADVYVVSFSLDGLMEHGTELDTIVCYTDTHCYTEVVMATAALLGYELAPRIKDIKDRTHYKMDRQQHYANLDPILSGTIKPHVIRKAWDETVRVIASMEERIVSPSMVLQRLGSYARQNSVYQTLSEIGRIQKRSTF